MRQIELFETVAKMSVGQCLDITIDEMTEAASGRKKSLLLAGFVMF